MRRGVDPETEVRSATDFDSIGSFECSSADLNRLQATRLLLANFVGIPTDCPHREKNGWTGDAQLAAETGSANFDSAGGYGQWVDTRDCQRLNGAARHQPCAAGLQLGQRP